MQPLRRQYERDRTPGREVLPVVGQHVERLALQRQVQDDAVPGRLNELWVHINEPGTYYGQCSELCGANHGFMPITVEAVSREAFEAWVAEAQTKFARADDGPVVAAAPSATAGMQD